MSNISFIITKLGKFVEKFDLYVNSRKLSTGYPRSLLCNLVIYIHFESYVNVHKHKDTHVARHKQQVV